jgi:Cu-Zn family superoxide dismutase
MAGPGHAGDMPNSHTPPNGSLEVGLVDTAIMIDRAKPNSVFQPDGTAVVIQNGKDDYVTDPAGNAGSRISCSVINQDPTTVGRTRAQ